MLAWESERSNLAGRCCVGTCARGECDHRAWRHCTRIKKLIIVERTLTAKRRHGDSKQDTETLVHNMRGSISRTVQHHGENAGVRQLLVIRFPACSMAQASLPVIVSKCPYMIIKHLDVFCRERTSWWRCWHWTCNATHKPTITQLSKDI